MDVDDGDMDDDPCVATWTSGNWRVVYVEATDLTSVAVYYAHISCEFHTPLTHFHCVNTDLSLSLSISLRTVSISQLYRYFELHKPRLSKYPYKLSSLSARMPEAR